MNSLDWVIVVVFAFSVLVAVVHGFFFEVISLLGSLLAFVLAAWFYPLLAPRFLPYVKSVAIADLASFLTILIAVVLISGASARLARWLMKEVGLRWFDRLLGAAFGLLRGAVVMAAVVLALATFAPGSRLLGDSALGGYLLLAARGIVWAAPADLQQRFRDGLAGLRQRLPAESGKPSPGHNVPAAGHGK